MGGVLGWLIILGGPLLCAAAGAGVVLLLMPRRLDRAWDDGYESGWNEAAYRAQQNYEAMHPDTATITAIYPPGSAAAIADPAGADAIWDQIADSLRADFAAIRAGLTPSGPA